MVGVLHTWTRALIYPHVHDIVSGGGLNERGEWRSSREDFLVPVRAVSVIFRAKFRVLPQNQTLELTFIALICLEPILARAA
jgi:hypothetical protein